MAFMEPEIYRGEYYAVDTSIGNEIVPADVVGTVNSVADLAEYVEGEISDSVPPPVKTGWLFRLSAPGYLDCTDWSVADSEEEARAELEEMYGPFDSDD
jgi:hypothetical protein